jgi:hypothetical protein
MNIADQLFHEPHEKLALQQYSGRKIQACCQTYSGNDRNGSHHPSILALQIPDSGMVVRVGALKMGLTCVIPRTARNTSTMEQ